MVQNATREWKLEGDLAANYEKYFVPAIFQPWATRLLDTAQLKPGERVLDVATGTGIVARLAKERVGPNGAVTGLDLNPAMLAVAGSVAPVPAIEWKQANAADTSLPDESFDVVLCQQGLQFFPDKAAALKEFHRVLAPGGRFVLSVWRTVEEIPGYGALADALSRYVSEEAGTFLRVIGSLGDAAELERLLEGAWFVNIEVSPSSGTLIFPSVEAFVWQMVQTTPLAWMSAVNQADDTTRTKVITDMDAELASFIGPDGLVFPIGANVATAQRAEQR